MLSETERDDNLVRIKYQLAQEFATQLKTQLKSVEETLQRSKREYAEVVFGEFSSVACGMVKRLLNF